MAIYLINALYLDWQTYQTRHATIKVTPGPHGGIEFTTKIDRNETIVDCSGKLAMKSFACGHHHVYSALAAGMPAPLRAPKNFPEILENIWWRLDKALDEQIVEASALAAAIICAKNGVTFIIDHHSAPLRPQNHLETIAQAFDKVGVSHLLCLELSNRDGELPPSLGLAESERYLQTPNRFGLVGLHASFTVGDALLQKAVSLANRYQTGIHMHVAEDIFDQQDCRQVYNCSVVERLQKAGALESGKTILAHCLHLSEEERAILRNSPVWIAQNTESNQNNAVGVFSGAGLGDHIFFGSDGMHGDMIRSARAAFLSGQAAEKLSPAAAYDRLRNVHRYLHANSIPGDGDNNLVIFDYNPPTVLNSANFLGHFFYALDSRHVDSVIANGKLIVRNNKMVSIDEAAVMSNAREMSLRLWENMSRIR